jgi:hypothetical protein
MEVTGPNTETTVLVVLMLQYVAVTVGTDRHKNNFLYCNSNLDYSVHCHILY